MVWEGGRAGRKRRSRKITNDLSNGYCRHQLRDGKFILLAVRHADNESSLPTLWDTKVNGVKYCRTSVVSDSVEPFSQHVTHACRRREPRVEEARYLLNHDSAGTQCFCETHNLEYQLAIRV